MKSNYTLVLSHHYTQFVNDPDQDLLNSLTNPYWGSKVNASQTGRISPFALVNLSASYQINQRASVSLIVNNVFNSIKQDTSAGWPYYPVGNYNPYGRQGWLEFNYHCGVVRRQLQPGRRGHQSIPSAAAIATNALLIR